MSVFYFNRLPVLGPWGGGNKTITAIVERLVSLGHTVLGEMRDDVDVVFCVDPRPSSGGVTYQQIFEFAARKKIPLIQRVGDVGTHGKPDLTHLVKLSMSLSDHVIFTSEWAKNYVGCSSRCSVIQNGAMTPFFQSRGVERPPGSRIRIVTHHWSNNPMKGIALYERLSEEIDQGVHNFDFTYVGRSSPKLEPRTVSPLDVGGLVAELPRHDIYISASLYEAGANHILEAMACGLPVIYSSLGGSIPEYCGGRGIEFNTYEGLIASIESAACNLDQLRASSRTYRRTIDAVVDEYLEILCAK